MKKIDSYRTLDETCYRSGAEKNFNFANSHKINDYEKRHYEESAP